MRVVQIPAKDNLLGEHMARILVVPDEMETQSIYADRYADIDDFKSDLAEIGYSFYTMFKDTLRYNNAPDWYDPAAMLHQFDANIAALSSYYTQTTELTPTVELFDRLYNISSDIQIATGENYCIMHNTPGLATAIKLDNQPLGANYAFKIRLPVLKESMFDGNKFNIEAGTYAGILEITVSRSNQNDYVCSVFYSKNAGGEITALATNALNGHTADVVENDDDPYDPDGDGDSGGGGGGGNHDDSSDPVLEPDLPSLSAVASGFINLYNPTLQQIRDLASYMYSSLTDLDVAAIRKIFANPMDAILGLSIVPVAMTTSGAETIKIGGISTTCSMNKVTTQYYRIDCGSIDLKEYWGGFIDYSPYTKYSLFLPYIGFVDLNVEMLQTRTLKITYHIDVLSGACTAFIMADGQVRAQYSGQCTISIPIAATDYTNTIRAMGQLAASALSFAASGGLSAPVNAAQIGGMASAAANSVGTVTNMKPSYKLSGSIGGCSGLLGNQKPFLLVQYPRVCLPANQNHYQGYPSYITLRLGDISGFTQVQSIKLDNIACTDAERNEILDMLRNGVIL